MRRLLLWVMLLLASTTDATAAPATSEFSTWAVVVIAGDWRSHDGGETRAFDNTRSDISAALVKAGFDPANLVQYSLRPPRPGDDPRVVTTPGAAMAGFQQVAGRVTGGCLFYVSSHGSPEGAVFGPTSVLTPLKLHVLLDNLCPNRPTVAVISACFSGVFEATAAPNRLILTAARADRSSFGCSDKDRYPYFDACILESLPESGDFLILSRKARACVARREADQHLKPPSEPQTFVGAQAQLWAPFLKFAGH